MLHVAVGDTWAALPSTLRGTYKRPQAIWRDATLAAAEERRSPPPSGVEVADADATVGRALVAKLHTVTARARWRGAGPPGTGPLASGTSAGAARGVAARGVAAHGVAARGAAARGAAARDAAAARAG